MNRLSQLRQRWHRVPIRARGTAIIAIPVTCLFTALSAFAWLKASLVEDETWVQHTQVVRFETKRLLSALLDAETGVRGYGLTQRSEFLTPYNSARTEIPAALDRLENLVQDNPGQSERVRVIRSLVGENLLIFQQKLILQRELRRIRGHADTLIPAASLYDWLEEGKASMDAVRLEIDRFAQTEEALLTQRQAHQNSYRQITWVVLCISGAIGTLAAWFAVHLFHQLERELAQRELHLRQTNDRLEVACDQLQRFTANASHELRAPLAAMLGNAQVGLMDLASADLLDDPTELSASLHKRFEKVVTLAKQMGGLVDELLFLARHEGLIEAMQPVDLVGLLGQLAIDWKFQAETGQLQLCNHLPGQAVMVQGDGGLLRQAVANLLSNACRYTQAGGTIHLRLDTAGEQASIQVEDTGIGIPAESLPHVFERFYRVDQKRSRASGGYGLGLAIAHQIVAAHGGQIQVSSTVGKGSRFEITLPLSPSGENLA